MKVIYLAGPYTHDDPMMREIRYHYLVKAEAHLLRQGNAVISPINMCHELGKIYGFSYGYEYWQSRDRSFLERCDELVVLKVDGWKESVGVTDEIFWAKQKEIPISFIELDELEPV
jgi:hypothetical protein